MSSGHKRLKLEGSLQQLDGACSALQSLAEDKNPASKDLGQWGAALLDVKALNRTVMQEGRQGKARTQEEKQHMDRVNLQLQNLQYERMNLAKQLESLQAQKPAVPWSDLISLDKSHPGALGPQEIMRRLGQELEERRRLEAEVATRGAEAAQAEGANEERRKRLASATLELDIVVERAERVRDTVFEPGRTQRNLNFASAASTLTTQALYTLYLKAAGHLEAFPPVQGKAVTVALGSPVQMKKSPADESTGSPADPNGRAPHSVVLAFTLGIPSPPFSFFPFLSFLFFSFFRMADLSLPFS